MNKNLLEMVDEDISGVYNVKKNSEMTANPIYYHRDNKLYDSIGLVLGIPLFNIKGDKIYELDEKGNIRTEQPKYRISKNIIYNYMNDEVNFIIIKKSILKSIASYL